MDVVRVPCFCRVPLPVAELTQAPGARPSSSAAISDYGEDESESPDAVAIAAALRDAGVDALGRDASSASAFLQASESSDTALGGEDPPTQDGELTESQLSRLTHVLERSALYSSILERQMREARARHALTYAEANSTMATTTAKGKAKGKGKKAAKRRRVDDEDEKEEATPAFPQPKLITGATLHPYQLEGLQWMLGLDEQGISGILADEMGLGKTLQTIAFCAHLRHERRATRPFLVVCPLSVLHNWVEEFARFAPEIPVVLYHGTPAERAEMRRTVMRMPEGWPRAPAPAPAASGSVSTSANSNATTAPVEKKRGRPAKGSKSTDKDKTKLAPIFQSAKNAKNARKEAAQALDDAHDAHFAAFPVVVTTYDLIIRDRPVLGGIPWGYIVVDEGHRLKNMHCALMREVKRYSSAGRMVLTGTPLHNNLAELWSLLNFILPDIFDDVDAFQEWFSLPRMSALLPSARMGTFISTLHTILKPFLLRRMKADVLGSALPPKKSYVLYARLSARQHEAYEAVLKGEVRAWVAGGMGASSASASTSASASAATTSPLASGSGKQEDVTSGKQEDEGRTLRTRKRRHGKGKGRGDDAERAAEEEEERRRVAEAFAKQGKAKHVNNMKLQNTVMQLRKVCSHPFLFARPDDDKWSLGRAPVTPELLAVREAELVGASGKMLLLDRLLGELFRRGHKVLLFSQFTTMLDIIEDWAVDMKGWKICRIDGTTPPLERRDQMNVFQSAGDAPDAPRLFLLSTRSGGLGVNLTAADTVIFYDQDWNPQMDAQAQDRAHRIGQTKPVLIFRLVSARTIEEKIMQRATEKRKLEALVIAKGKFTPAAADANAPGKRTTMAEMAADLLRLEGEQIDVLPTTTHAGDADVLSDADLEALLDRSPEVFADRGTGWKSSAKGQAAFAVFEPPADAGSDALAGLIDGEEAVEE
ncbi:SNF2 family DNA-dependent ATPase [Mycena alexandri]|uniref:SNF2 family DNA-dependent ATPase n=1 Tax=Mycena alexandri TaxID=1745969 RepID=A0AAD6WQ66_9AGAR|nr:SNF2 family DNA-dependent ATPase [Mycena alexandri]